MYIWQLEIKLYIIY